MSQERKISNGDSRSSRAPPSGLIVKVKYNNTLPDIPFDPKFLVNPLNISRFVKYEPTSLEQNSKHELITPQDLGVDIDLILPERYAISENAVHDPEDDRLLADDEALNTSQTKKSPRDKPHSQLHNKVVPWLKKTEYISTEYNRYGSTSEKTETKVGYKIIKNRKADMLMDRESQIKAINKSFEEAQKPIEKHHAKPGVYAKQVLPLLPDYDMWKYVFSQVIFDSEPADASRSEQMAQAIIRGAVDEETKEEYVAYFLPTEITMADRLLDQNNALGFSEGKEYEYQARREYNWNGLKNEAEDFYFFTFRDDNVYYNQIDNLVRLNKRRSKVQSRSISTLIVKSRPLNEQDIEIQKQRLLKLETVQNENRADLTAQFLEDSYEGQNKSSQESNRNDEASSQDDNADDDAESESSSSVASKSSSSASSDSTSSSSEDSDDDDDDDDDDDEDDDNKTKKSSNGAGSSKMKKKKKSLVNAVFGSDDDDDESKDEDDDDSDN